MIGQRVNNYEIVSLLGQGGMGSVYAATHPVLDRKVAVKFLKREFAEDKPLVERFFNEARAASSIRHPNIIEIIDVGLMPDGLPYILMEHLDGETLSKRIERAGRLSVAEALQIFSGAAGALEAAHTRGIVHRDLKPDNLYLVPDSANPGLDRVKVLDFGIAKLRKELSGGSYKTQTGSIMGTPPYMSPEQCMGITGEIDHRTDIYAMAIILYEMLCGGPPFVGEGFGEVLMKHMTQVPVPPSQHNPEIPPHVEAAILRALAKKRDERFANLAEFQLALGVATGTFPPRSVPAADVSTRPATMSPRPATFSSRPGALAPAPGGTGGTLPPAAPTGTGARQVTTFSATNGTVADEDAIIAGPGRRRGILIVGGVAAAVFLAVVLMMGLTGGKKVPPSGAASAGAPAQLLPVAAPPVPAPPTAAAAPTAAPAAQPAAVAPAESPPPAAPAPELAKAKPVAQKPKKPKAAALVKMAPASAPAAAVAAPKPSPQLKSLPTSPPPSATSPPPAAPAKPKIQSEKF